MPDKYEPLITPPASLTEPAVWLVFRKAEVLVVNGADVPAMPCCLNLSEHGLAPRRSQYLGLYGGRHCYAAEVHESQALPDGWTALGLRDLFGLVDTTLAALSGRAYQLLDWDRNHQFCSRCGTKTEPRKDERSRVCPACWMTTYPPITPAIMILITHQGKLLLARKPTFPKNRFSALAGFVEPGETIEEAVAREVLEEAGVRVRDVRYIASQPWPFPSQLMIGCHAKATSDVLAIDPNELEDARWFARAEVAEAIENGEASTGLKAPTSRAIAHYLLRWWLEETA
jgi:NAD+ diphosphatase